MPKALRKTVQFIDYVLKYLCLSQKNIFIVQGGSFKFDALVANLSICENSVSTDFVFFF